MRNTLIITINKNGTYTNENGYDEVIVNVPTGGGDAGDYEEGYNKGYEDGVVNGVEQGKEEQKSLLESITISKNGTYTNENGYDEVIVNVSNVELKSRYRYIDFISGYVMALNGKRCKLEENIYSFKILF